MGIGSLMDQKLHIRRLELALRFPLAALGIVLEQE